MLCLCETPQSNGLVERANRSLGKGIKARLGEGNKNWIEELPHVLWAHRRMIKSSHGDTPFSLDYVRKPSYHRIPRNATFQIPHDWVVGRQEGGTSQSQEMLISAAIGIDEFYIMIGLLNKLSTLIIACREAKTWIAVVLDVVPLLCQPLQFV
ncbi:reverse transcriptase domain-containing protein [Tanacetum coccineum]